MPLTDAQLTLLGQKRKQNPPSYFNADTGESQGISGDTEDALILIGSEVKQKAAQYLDLLLAVNPSKGDHDTIVARAATKQLANSTAALAELETVISGFSAFRDDLGDATEAQRLYSEGIYPILYTITKGIGKIRNSIDKLKFYKKVNTIAEARYASNLTDAQRKEWRSWKRVLLAYP